MFTVLIRGIEVYGYHGVPAEERAIGHRYRLDLSLEVAGSADFTDDVGDTVDYGAASLLAAEIVSSSQFHTVEKLAGVIADKLLGTFPKILSLEIVLVKAAPPVPLVAESMGVRLRRSRGVAQHSGTA